jgi:predicted dehydrogenase
MTRKTALSETPTSSLQSILHKAPTRILRVGVIGCGYWGPKLLRNFRSLETTKVEYACDLRQNVLDELERSNPGIKTTKEYWDLLRSDIDAVVIATPVSTHYRLASEALANGKHVLVEKPMAGSSSECETLIDIASDMGLTLMVGHTFEYNPAVEMLRDIVRSGEIGEVFYVSTTRTNLGLFQPDINVIWDLAPHDLSILMYTLGVKPISVSATGAAYVQPGIHDVARLTVNFEGGTQAHCHLSWLDPNKVRQVTVVGSRRMVVYDDVATHEKIKIYDKGVEVPERTADIHEFQLSYRYGDIAIPRIPGHEPLALECAHFADCILEGRTPRSSGRDGLNVVKILESADESLQNGGVAVPIKFGVK